MTADLPNPLVSSMYPPSTEKIELLCLLAWYPSIGSTVSSTVTPWASISLCSPKSSSGTRLCATVLSWYTTRHGVLDMRTGTCSYSSLRVK